MMDIADLRQEYSRDSIDVSTVDDCPFQQFEKWFNEACRAELTEPNAMVLSTVNDIGCPTQRTVLLKIFDRDGFVFFTNYGSRKAQHLAKNENASLLFPWFELQRQVEISGRAEKLSFSESVKYFASRPRGSQLGAWVSHQSSVISNRSILQNKLAEMKAKFTGGKIPMPTGWGGFRVIPNRFEFWQGGVNRLHDRIEYQLTGDDGWQRQRLSP